MILTIYTATTMIIIAYLLGSIPSAVWIGKKYYGIDIREHNAAVRRGAVGVVHNGANIHTAANRGFISTTFTHR